jgi:hypothetical protein
MKRTQSALTVLLLGTLALGTIGSTGCGSLLYRMGAASNVPQVPNPAPLPPLPPEVVWLQVVDVVDDHFRILREQPVQNRGGVVMEGRLDTANRIGGTWLEPWRTDSTHGFEKWQSTLQTIRRRATVTVRPEPSGYSLEVIVFKELEVVNRSQASTEAAAAFRHDGTIVRTESLLNSRPRTLGWQPIGRDASLEARILGDILGRLTQPDAPSLLTKH